MKAQKYSSVLIHVFGWGFLLLLPFFIQLPLKPKSEVYFYKFFAFAPGLCGLFYLNMYLLVPKVLLKGRLLSYISLLAAVIGILVLYNYFLENFFNLTHTFVVDDPQHGVIVRRNFVHFMPVVTSILVIGVSTSVKVTSQWLEDRDRQQKLEKEKLGTELSWLKTQLNPHFFF
ncbi:MAG: hypothetical protein AAF734_08165, partial [Bacteroidota bacterium]